MSSILDPLWRLLDSFPGPIFSKELNAAGRRKTTYWLRGLFVLGMVGLVWLTIVGQVMRSFDATSLARVQSLQGLAPQVAASIIWFEAVCLTLAAAARSGGAICDERRKGSLASLLTTPLKTRQVVGGKILAGMAEVILLASTALPILLAVRIFGGVTATAILLCFSVMLSSVILTVCCTVLCSAFAKRSPSATLSGLALSACIQFGPLLAFGVLALFGRTTGGNSLVFTLSTPVTLAWLTASEIFGAASGFSPAMGPWWWSIAYVGAFSAAIFIACTFAVRRIAREESLGTQLTTKRSPLLRAWWNLRGEVKIRTTSRAVGDNPVLWRESQQGVRWTSRIFVVRLLCVVVLIPLLWYANSSSFDDTAFFVVTIVGGLITLVSAAAATSGAISSERESRTMDVLLTTPLAARSIVMGKFMGTLRHRWFTLGVILLHHLVAGCLIFHRSAWPLLLYPLILIPPTAALGATGLWLSAVTRKTSTAAALNLTLAAGAWLGVPIASAILDNMLPGNGSIFSSATLAFNPVVQLQVATEGLLSSRGLRWISGGELSLPEYVLMLLTVGAGYLIVTAISLELAWRSLRRSAGL